MSFDKKRREEERREAERRGEMRREEKRIEEKKREGMDDLARCWLLTKFFSDTSI